MSAPSWVRTPQGGLEPFDADRIARSLFAAGAVIGLRDALVCRELADAVVHFLAEECEGTPTTAEVADAVGRAVRELGQPALARAYEERRPSRATAGVYAADVLAAHEGGLIELIDLDGPDQLSRVVAAPDAIREAQSAGTLFAVDGVEYLDRPERLQGVPGLAYPNLNVTPPPWTSIAAGPLFASVPAADRGLMRREAVHRRALLRQRPEWHLGEEDLGGDGLLETVTGLALQDGYPTAFVLDRPRRPIALGGGLTRQHPAVLTRVGLNLVALAERPGLLADVDRYVERLGSLARLALSAAVQKREHLRRQNRPAITDGFLLDRARFVAVAHGLDEVVRRFTGWSLANGGPSLELGKRVVQRLVDVLRQEGRGLQLETFLDGLTPDAPGASIRAQMQAAGALHAIAEGGTLRLHLPREAVHTGATLAEELRRGWRETAVGRVEIVKASQERERLE